MTLPRIVCIGANEESRVALEGLLAAGVNVVALVTRPAGEPGAASDYRDLHPLCAKWGVPTIDTTDINAPATIASVRRAAPGYVYTLGWSQLFGPELLSTPSQYVVGSHPSPLPVGRGRAPAPWTILEGRTHSAVSLFRMTRGVDDGDLLVQRWFSVPPNAYVGELYETIAENLRDAFLDLHAHHREGRTPPPISQDESLATHRAKRSPADGWIDFRAPAADIERLVRAVSRPYPGAYAYYRDSRVTVWAADRRATPAHVGRPGQVLAVAGGRLLVGAGDGPIWLSELEVDGAPAPCERFRVGASFGYRVEDELCRLRRQVAKLKEELASLRQPAAGRSAA